MTWWNTNTLIYQKIAPSKLTLFHAACPYVVLFVAQEHADEHVEQPVEVAAAEPVEIVVEVLAAVGIVVAVGQAPAEIVAVVLVGIVAEESGLVERIVVADLVETVGVEVAADDPVVTAVAATDIGPN